MPDNVLLASRNDYPAAASVHPTCETPRHAGRNLEATHIMAIVGDTYPDGYVQGLCLACYETMQADLEADDA